MATVSNSNRKAKREAPGSEPGDRVVEMALVGSLTSYPLLIPTVVPPLRAEDFWSNACRTVFARIVKMRQDSQDINEASVIAELERHGVLEQIGGKEFIYELDKDATDNEASVKEFTRRVREMSGWRCAIKIGERIATAGWNRMPLPDINRMGQEVTDLGAGITKSLTPWSQAEDLKIFLDEKLEDRPDFLDREKRLLARASVTEIYSPRGLGKSLFALGLALELAGRGLRVLYIDRDNPQRIVRFRLRSFGADITTPGLKIISREKCPPLTNAAAWALFPYADYDVVILDSFDAAAEGVGEQDSAKPSRAIAPVLDIARRENGPAVLILGNCVRTAKHSRGSGVVEDRWDVVYEVRDATDFHPTGSKTWFEELPIVGAEGWAGRASRRKQREKFRLAFVTSKFRIGPEAEPFVVEIDLTMVPWVIRDVTDEVDREGTAFREQRAAQKAAQLDSAAAKLEQEITRRAESDEPPMRKRQDAEKFLVALGLKWHDARELLADRNGKSWSLQISLTDKRITHVLARGGGKMKTLSTSRHPYQMGINIGDLRGRIVDATVHAVVHIRQL